MHSNQPPSGTCASCPTAQTKPAKRGTASDCAAAAAAQPGPLLVPFLAAHGLIHAFCLLQMLGLWAASVSAQPPPWGSLGYLTLSAFELFTVGFDFSFLHGLFTKRLSTRQVLDSSLIVVTGLVLPFQTLLILVHPPFLAAEQNWAAFASYLVGSGVFVGSFPPAYSLVQWVLTTICFTALDCYGRRSHGQQCPFTIWGLAACYLSRGLLIGAAGLAAWATAYVVVMKNSARLHSQTESIASRDLEPGAGSASGVQPDQQQQQQHAPCSRPGEAADAMPSQSSSVGRAPLPFESCGMGVPPAAVRFFSLLDRSLIGLAEAVNEEVLVRLVCLPVMLYAIGLSLLARMKLQGVSCCSMSPDTLLIYVMASFMVGRNSSNFDIGPLVLKIQAVASAAFARASRQPSLVELVDRLRQHVAGAVRPGAAPGSGHHITVTELLGEGAFGKVYKGMWRGTAVAVKRMVLPGNLLKSDRRERMAIMEAAISGALVHPNVVQTYTYTVQSVQGGSTAASEVHVGDTLEHVPGVHASSGVPTTPAAAEACSSTAAGALEVQLVLEYMDCGALRDVLDDGCFEVDSPSDEHGTSVNYYAMLETAADVAKGMMHLHSLNVIHCDLKARNVLLKSCASDPRSFTAKVGDFGLSLKLDSSQTSVDNCFHGTPTHMAPEVHTLGRQSKAADVFSFGITMWELYTGGRAFEDVDRALLCHFIALQGNRPPFPPNTPRPYAALAARCWDPDPEARPRFEEVVDRLLELIPAESGDMVPVPVTVLGAQVTVFRPLLDAPLCPVLPLANCNRGQLAPSCSSGRGGGEPRAEEQLEQPLQPP